MAHFRPVSVAFLARLKASYDLATNEKVVSCPPIAYLASKINRPPHILTNALLLLVFAILILNPNDWAPLFSQVLTFLPGAYGTFKYFAISELDSGNVSQKKGQETAINPGYKKWLDYWVIYSSAISIENTFGTQLLGTLIPLWWTVKVVGMGYVLYAGKESSASAVQQLLHKGKPRSVAKARPTPLTLNFKSNSDLTGPPRAIRREIPLPSPSPMKESVPELPAKRPAGSSDKVPDLRDSSPYEDSSYRGSPITHDTDEHDDQTGSPRSSSDASKLADERSVSSSWPGSPISGSDMIKLDPQEIKWVKERQDAGPGPSGLSPQPVMMLNLDHMATASPRDANDKLGPSESELEGDSEDQFEFKTTPPIWSPVDLSLNDQKVARSAKLTPGDNVDWKKQGKGKEEVKRDTDGEVIKLSLDELLEMAASDDTETNMTGAEQDEDVEEEVGLDRTKPLKTERATRSDQKNRADKEETRKEGRQMAVTAASSGLTPVSAVA